MIVFFWYNVFMIVVATIGQWGIKMITSTGRLLSPNHLMELTEHLNGNRIKANHIKIHISGSMIEK